MKTNILVTVEDRCLARDYVIPDYWIKYSLLGREEIAKDIVDHLLGHPELKRRLMDEVLKHIDAVRSKKETTE